MTGGLRSSLSVSRFGFSRSGSNTGSGSKNGGPDADHRRAFLDGDLEIVAHPHGQLRHHGTIHALCHEPVPERAQLPEIWPGLIRIVDRGRQQPQPDDARRLRRARGLEDWQQLIVPRPVLRRLAREIGLHEQIDPPSRRVGGIVDLSQQIRVVDRMDHGEAGRLLRFVRLEMSDQMPADGQVQGLRALLQRFLNLVFAEIRLSAFGGGADVLDGKCFRDGDEGNGGWIAPGPAGCARDAVAHAGQPGPERRNVDHYFFGSDPRMFFAVAAFGPVGAIFRYVSNSVAAPARLPSFTSAMPSW